MEKEMIFTSGKFQLSGTLRLPDGDSPRGLVLLVAGSGQVDRDENHPKIHINALREIADYLAKQGIVTFRYDKRGVGKSEGNFWETGFLDNVLDASAAVTLLKSNPQFGTKPLFVLGHSEGALICTRLAAEHPAVAGAVLIAGAAQTGEEVLRWQAREVSKGLRGLNGLVIRLLRIDVIKAQDKVLRRIKSSTKNWFRQGMVAKINAKWFREFMACDPAKDLARIQIPVLAVTGSKDIQVDPCDLTRMAELVKSDFEYHEISNMSHMLRIEDGIASVASYQKQVKQPVDPRLLQIIGDWLEKHD